MNINKYLAVAAIATGLALILWRTHMNINKYLAVAAIATGLALILLLSVV